MADDSGGWLLRAILMISPWLYGPLNLQGTNSSGFGIDSPKLT